LNLYKPTYILGCDLGQTHDPTAVCVLRKSSLLDEEGKPVKDAFGKSEYTYLVGFLHRFALNTPYPDVIRELVRIASAKDLDGPMLAIDSSGVGRGVTDELIREKIPGRLVPITITSAATSSRGEWNDTGVTAYRVGKYALISGVQLGLQNRTLRILETIENAALLRRELENFRIKVSISGNELFDAKTGEYDDLLLAIASPWQGGENRWATGIPRLPGQRSGPRLIGFSAGDEATKYEDPFNRR